MFRCIKVMTSQRLVKRSGCPECAAEAKIKSSQAYTESEHQGRGMSEASSSPVVASESSGEAAVRTKVWLSMRIFALGRYMF